MWDWWAPPEIRLDRSAPARQVCALIVGRRKFGAPLLHSSDGRAWEMHPLQYTRAWRVSYSKLNERFAIERAVGLFSMISSHQRWTSASNSSAGTTVLTRPIWRASWAE